jgi:hypothetical protein
VAAFVVAGGFAPLYHANQNQYFFHGLAQAGVGALRADWLAGTAEVWPLFSHLVHLTVTVLHPGVFHLYYAGLVALYAATLLRIALPRPDGGVVPAARWLFLAGLTVLHSPAVGRWSVEVLGANLPGQLVRGVALQDLLGQMLQPATFGVLLLVAVDLFLRGRALGAAVAAAGAAAVHPAYLLTAATLLGAFLLILLRAGRHRTAAGVAAVGGALLLPVVAFAASTFGPTTAEAWRLSRQILVEYRFPHHAVVARWFGPMVLVKLAVVVAAILLVRRSALGAILTVWAVTALALTLVQVASGNQALAVLFPWRISVVLVPLATAVLLGRLCLRVAPVLAARPRGHTGVSVAAAALMVVLAAAGAAETRARAAAQQRDDRGALFAFVARTVTPAHVYLVPPRWDTFRLRTGAAAFADVEFIPYQDTAVLEWYRRVRLADAFYHQPRADRCGLAGVLAARYAVTHVVLPADRPACPGWSVAYEDARYRLYALSSPASGERAGPAWTR